MSASDPTRERDDVRSVTSLWTLMFAMWGGLVAWMVHLTAGLALVGAACDHGAVWSLHLLTGATALVAALAVAAGVRVLQATGGIDDAGWTIGGREAFMALVGVLLSGIGLWLILFEGIPTLFIGPCT